MVAYFGFQTWILMKATAHKPKMTKRAMMGPLDHEMRKETTLPRKKIVPKMSNCLMRSLRLIVALPPA